MKVNTTRKIKYVAQSFAEGLADLTLTVRRPDGTLFEFASGGVTTETLTEVADGVYEVSYTPDAIGIWTEKITSATNGDKAVNSVDVVATDISDVKSAVDTVDGKVDSVDGKVDTIDGKVDTVDGKIDNVKTDTESIESKIDDIDGQIKPGGYFAN